MDGSAEGRFSIRAICKEGSTFLQTLSAMAFVLRVSLVDAKLSPAPAGASPAHSRGKLTASALCGLVELARRVVGEGCF
jgi:hypothetical protein